MKRLPHIIALSVFSLLLPSLTLGLSIWEQLLLNPSHEEQLLSHKDINFSVSSTSEHHLILLHKHLSSKASVSGEEAEVVDYLQNYLLSSGFQVMQQKIPDTNRSNIYAYKGNSPDAKIVLTSHLDTVPGFFPYSTTPDGMIYGRGVNDAKGSVATQVIAAKELFKSREVQAGDLGLLFVVGEEVDGIGMEYVSQGPEFESVQWDHVIFGEPTELTLGVGHKGVYHFELSVEGKASHSGYPELGIDANLKLIDIIQRIRALEFEEDELLGLTTVNFGKLEGGLAANVVSPNASVKVIVRVASDVSKVRKQIQEAIEIERLEFSGLITLEESQVKQPVYLDYDVPHFETSVLKYFTDVPNLVKDSVKGRYLYGPGSIINAHTPDEHLSVSDLTEGVKGYKQLTKWLLENKY